MIILYAIARPTVEVVRAVAAAILVAQVPHFIYHAAHLEVLPTALDRVLQTASLALTWQFRFSSCCGLAVSASSMRRRPLNRPHMTRAEQHNGNHGWSYRRADALDALIQIGCHSEPAGEESRAREYMRREPENLHLGQDDTLALDGDRFTGPPRCQNPFGHTIVHSARAPDAEDAPA